jgi:protein-L-isoaspartate(D-aspartate) O-methyltransferase
MPSPRVLLLGAGYPFGGDGNFGASHLVSLGSYLRAHTDADVEVVDLDYEKALDEPDPQRIFDPSFTVVALSCYSSFDYLRSYYVGVELRRRNPGLLLVAGGYHPSARPDDFLGADSPFDHVVVGEGERPLRRLVAAAARGERLPERVLGPDPVPDLDDLPPFDWDLLRRYRPRARRIGGQLTIALSRGCPFHCAFCMEGAKGRAGWRAFSPERAVAEMRRVHEWLDLTDWTVFVTDPVFGLRPAWRAEVLDRLAALALPVRAYWALSRVDVVEPEDLPRFQRAGFGLGFGLESGDAEMIAIVRKSGPAGVAASATGERYLERFEALVEAAERLQLPWGVNVIAGHPGETLERLERSAAYLARVFGGIRGLSGSLSVDPYRFYPGSHIDHALPEYERRYGTRVHRPRWWDDSEPTFNASWVDPSRDLPYRTAARVAGELYGPLLRDIAARWSYTGRAAAYFRRAVDEQIEFLHPRHRVDAVRDYCLWRRLTGTGADDARTDPEVAALLREERGRVVAALAAEHPGASPALLEALREEPRERYVAEELVWESSQDEPLPLDDEAAASLSALHAYLASYGLLELAPGDRLLELGGGTGYGAAVAARVVGPRGLVRSYEIDERLAARARANLADRPQVVVVAGPARPEAAFDKVVFGYALAAAPLPFLDQLPVGGRLVAPLLGPDGVQRLTRFSRGPEGVERTEHGEVVYVPDAEPSGPPPAP